MNIIRKNIENKSIIWFEKSNQYVVFENRTADIIECILNGDSLHSIGTDLACELSIPDQAAVDFVIRLKESLVESPSVKSKFEDATSVYKISDVDFNYSKYYKIYNKIILIRYQTFFEWELIHPKFAHLTIEKFDTIHLRLEIFTVKNETFLFKNGAYFNRWIPERIHYLQGKISMLIIQEIYEKDEGHWIGVFHASAISNGKKVLLFLGDSGSGKSTSLALLQKQRYTCLADDFVPMGTNKKIYSFPSAISVKEHSWDVLSEYYPDLISNQEYCFNSHQKTVKYLEPIHQQFDQYLECTKLIFIKYQRGARTVLEPISNAKAFEKLIPDSWISPMQNNVQSFLDWFTSVQCYNLTYSQNQEMFQTVDQIFDNEL